VQPWKIRNATISKFKLTDAKRVTFEIKGVVAVFAILILFVGGRRVGDFPITSNEIIQLTYTINCGLS
jgi:hypothetical protein